MRIIAYANEYGAVGWGVIEKSHTYHLAKRGGDEDYWSGDCMHRLSINWKATATNLSDGVRPGEVRKSFDIYHPISTSVTIELFKAKNLVEHLTKKLGAGHWFS